MRPARPALRSTSVRQECGLRHLEDRQCVLTGDRGKIVQELVERVATLDVLDEGLHGHTRAREDWDATQAVGRGRDQGARQAHQLLRRAVFLNVPRTPRCG